MGCRAACKVSYYCMIPRPLTGTVASKRDPAAPPAAPAQAAENVPLQPRLLPKLIHPLLHVPRHLDHARPWPRETLARPFLGRVDPHLRPVIRQPARMIQ